MAANNNTNDNHSDFDLKILKRYKKIYLYKRKFFELKQSGELDDSYIAKFKKSLMPKGVINKDNNAKILDIDENEKIKWFEKTDSQSFKAETSQIVRKLPISEARNFQKDLTEFENAFSSIKSSEDRKNLYYQKVTKCILKERDKAWDRNKYTSLTRFFKLNYPAVGATTSETTLRNFRDFIENDLNRLCSLTKDNKETNKKQNNKKDDRSLRDLLSPKYASFVFENSDEFKRRILNVFFSIMADVDSSDEVPFVRKTGKAIDYTIFRILVWLRNPNFNFEDFKHFLSGIDAHDLPNRMTIDYGITGIIKIFLRHVSKPEWIDNLIKTHRIVKGLWQNGSKFLNSYTLHNEDHAVKLIELSVDIKNRIDYIQLKRADFYILFLSCYLHDISMVIHPDLQVFSHVDYKNLNSMAPFVIELKKLINEFDPIKIPKDEENNKDIEDLWKGFGVTLSKVFNEVYSFFERKVRDNHPNDSANFLIAKSESLFSYIDPSAISHVAHTGKDHGKGSADIFGISSTAREDTISQKYISIVLRLADLLDVSNDRINYHLLSQNVQHLPEISKYHWISHLITDDIQLIPTYHLKSNPIEIDGKEFDDYYIQETLRFYLILNVKSTNPICDKNCKFCSEWHREKYDGSDCPEAYKDFEGLTIKLGAGSCEYKSCPMICRWMTHKHKWLFEELKALDKYLKNVNHHPFRTEIEVNILFKDLYNIEPYLYDSVVEYLKNQK